MTHSFPQPPLDLNPDPTTEDVAALIHDLVDYLEILRRALSRQTPHYQTGSATFNPSNLVDGAGETTTVTVTGAALGDLAFASFSLDLQAILLTAWVSATDVVSVRFQNETTGAVDLASGTLRAYAMRPPTAA